MKFRPSNTCYLSCRIWLQKRFPAANVVSVQLEGERGNGALTHLRVLDGLAEGAFNREQHPRCALVQECHYGFTCQKQRFFFFYNFCCCRHQLVGAGEVGVRLTFTAMLRAKVTLSAAVSTQEQSAILERIISKVSLLLCPPLDD